MVVYRARDETGADQVFHALADATRRDIVRRAMEEAHPVSALARHYPMSFAAVQKHVAVLERAGLVTKERRGRERLVRTDIRRLRAAARVLDEFESLWRIRVEQMDEIIAEDQTRRSPPGKGVERCP
jgi:DNA-binding transcriptional ArsR family regulator